MKCEPNRGADIHDFHVRLESIARGAGILEFRINVVTKGRKIVRLVCPFCNAINEGLGRDHQVLGRDRHLLHLLSKFLEYFVAFDDGVTECNQGFLDSTSKIVNDAEMC